MLKPVNESIPNYMMVLGLSKVDFDIQIADKVGRLPMLKTIMKEVGINEETIRLHTDGKEYRTFTYDRKRKASERIVLRSWCESHHNGDIYNEYYSFFPLKKFSKFVKIRLHKILRDRSEKSYEQIQESRKEYEIEQIMIKNLGRR
jgi:hypothetical protein